MTIGKEPHNQLKDYLLNQLDEAAKEEIEVRLLSDPDYVCELNIVTNELIDQYATDQLPARDRELVHRFVLATPERRKKLKFALALKRRATEVKQRNERWRNWPRLFLPIAASILVTAGFGIWWAFFYRTDVEKGLLALRAAYRDYRPVEGRVTEFSYAPALRGQENVDSVQRNLAAQLLTVAAKADSDAYTYRALGQYYITQRQFEQAVRQLSASKQLNSQDAKTHSDLGLALFELGKQAQANNESGRGLQYFGESVGELKTAIELDGTLLEARFNLPLVLQKMGMTTKAEESWREYLEKDSQSEWSREVRTMLAALEERPRKSSALTGSQALQDFMKAHREKDDERAWQVLSWNREVSTGKFVPIRLVNAYLEHQFSHSATDAADTLKALEYAGQLEASRGRDLHTSEVARFYRSLSPRHFATMARAQRLAGEGYELSRQTGFTTAIPLFVEARKIFISLGDEAESAFVDYWLAFSYFHAQQKDESRALVEELISYCRAKNYKWLLAQSLSLLSNIQTNFRKQSLVLNLDIEALALTQEVNDAYGTQKLLASLAGKYAVLYNLPEALNYLSRCLSLAEDFSPGPRQTLRTFDTAAQVFDALRLYPASAAYAEQALDLVLNGSTDETRDPSMIYLAHVRLGMAYGRLKNYAEGIRLAQSGLAIGKSIGNVEGKSIMAYSTLQLAELHRQKGDLKEAAAYYDQAIGLYNELNFQPFSVVAHKGRLLTYLAQGNDAAADGELQLVLKLLEEHRTSIKEDRNRTYFFEVAQEIYDAAIDFAYTNLQDKEKAFKYSEESRARSLLATMQGENEQEQPSRPELYSIHEIRDRSPNEVQVLQFAVLKDKLLIWLISKSDFVVREKRISREDLNEQVGAYLKLVTQFSSRIEDVNRASTQLYETLIKPVESHLVNGKTLCIVPDKILNHLPFAALRSPASQRYLIEDHAILFSPSSNVFVLSTELARTRIVIGEEKLLSVGNPTFNRLAFPLLHDLPSAASEAHRIAEFYDPSLRLVLTERKAQKEVVIEAMKNSHVLHLASHYVVDERWPMRSQLLLAQSPVRSGSITGSPDSLLASDIYSMKLDKPRLAVLAACRTGVERYYDGEGMIGMARTFLAARVPVVIASQWPVDTVSTNGLMVKFHEHRRRGGKWTLEALRTAQLEMINGSSSDRHPYFWAAFVPIGGYSPF